jgi:hypothetical protein
MNYPVIQPPFTLIFPEMSKRDLKAYNAWFHQIMPERLEILSETIRPTPGYERWVPDYSPQSLEMLGDWFASQVETRSRTQKEINRMQSGIRFPVGAHQEELTDRTFSLAVDIGMYLSQTLRKNHPSLQWSQPLGGKRFVDYGQPVLDGFTSGYFNPVRVLVAIAYGIGSKFWKGERLRAVYDIHSKNVCQWMKADGKEHS